MLKKTIKSMLLILVILSSFLVVFAQGFYEIIKDKNDNKVIIEVIINEKNFAGAEFSFSIQDEEELKPIKGEKKEKPFKLNAKLNASPIGLIEKDGKYFFGFYSSENIFDGETYVGELQFEYTGSKANKIVFDDVLIARLNEDKKAEGEYVKYPTKEYVIKRADDSGGSETPGGDNDGKDKNNNQKEETDTLKIGLDKENFLAYMTGYEDGTIRPENNITRAEAATIFYRLLLPEVREKYYSTENEFVDVDSDQWYNVYISTLCNAKILSGYDDKTFKPDKNLTRAEMVKIICQFEEINGDYETLFSDIENHWAENIINFATKSGWINGYPDKTFRPDSSITRAEVAVIVNNYLGRTMTEADMQKNIKQWKDNTEDKWYYKDILKATNY